MRHNEGQGKVQHAPDIVRASTTEPISALRSTIGSLWSAGCAWPRDRLNPDAASRSVVDFDPRLVADAAECLSLGLQTRRARPKSFLRRPPRARKRPSEPSCCRFPTASKADCAHVPARAKGQTDGLKGPMKDVISGVKSMMTEIMSFIAPFNPHLSVPELALALGRGRSRVATTHRLKHLPIWTQC